MKEVTVRAATGSPREWALRFEVAADVKGQPLLTNAYGLMVGAVKLVASALSPISPRDDPLAVRTTTSLDSPPRRSRRSSMRHGRLPESSPPLSGGYDTSCGAIMVRAPSSRPFE